jgi:hypothetical protein
MPSLLAQGKPLKATVYRIGNLVPETLAVLATHLKRAPLEAQNLENL